MAQEIVNLELDVDEQGPAARGVAPLRVCVESVFTYTRYSGAPVISRTCSSYPDFEREIGRLRSELDAILAKAQAHFGESVEEPAGETSEESQAETSSPTLMRIDGAKRVRDLMTTDVRTVSPNDRLKVAEELMSAGNFRHVVVVNEDNEVDGVLSQHDIMFAGVSWALGVGRTAHEKALESVAVKEVMSSQVVSVDPEEKLDVAAELLFQRKIGCLPVIEGSKLVGIVTEADFLAQFVRG